MAKFQQIVAFHTLARVSQFVSNKQSSMFKIVISFYIPNNIETQLCDPPNTSEFISVISGPGFQQQTYSNLSSKHKKIQFKMISSRQERIPS